MTNIAKAIIVLWLSCCSLDALARDYPYEEFNLLHSERGSIKIELLDFFAWRDWQPIVTRPGPDHGSPLMLIAKFKLTNTYKVWENANGFYITSRVAC